MAESKLVSCKRCGEMFPKDKIVTLKRSKYCTSCSVKVAEEIEGKQKFKCCGCGKMHDSQYRVKVAGRGYCQTCSVKAQIEVDRLLKLKDYIWECQGKDSQKIMVASVLIKKYVEEYGYSYNGILLTLKFFVKYKNGDISNGIGIVPYYYDEAKRFYQDIREINKVSKERSTPWITQEVVKVKPMREHRPHLNITTVNMDDIEV